jgi:hypothetical protein
MFFAMPPHLLTSITPHTPSLPCPPPQLVAVAVGSSPRQARVYDSTTGDIIATLDEAAAAAAATAAASVGVGGSSAAAGVSNGAGGGAGGGEMVRGSASACFSPSGGLPMKVLLGMFLAALWPGHYLSLCGCDWLLLPASALEVGDQRSAQYRTQSLRHVFLLGVVRWYGGLLLPASAHQVGCQPSTWTARLASV